MTRVIALSGWKGSGKDTVAQYLERTHGYKQLSFASKLKDMVAQLYGVERNWLDSQSHKEMPLIPYPVISTDLFTKEIHEMLSGEFRNVDGVPHWTPRALCILEGSIKRAVYPNYWILSTVREILDNPGQLYVVSDMRYRSEMTALSTLVRDIQFWRIERYAGSPSTDPSERDLDNVTGFDRRISNIGSLETLYATITLALNLCE